MLPHRRVTWLSSVLWLVSVVSGGTARVASGQATTSSQATTSPAAIALRDQINSAMDVSVYTGSIDQLGPHVVFNHVGAAYMVRRSNVLIASYYVNDKNLGKRVLVPAEAKGRSYPITKFCHSDSILALPEAKLTTLTDGCRHSLAIGRAGLIRSGRQFLLTDVNVFPEQDQVSFVLLDNHNVGNKKDPRYLAGVRVQFPQGFLRTATGAQVAAGLKPLLAKVDDPEAMSFMPDAPAPPYTLEDQLNTMYRATKFVVASESVEPDATLQVKADRFLRGFDMYQGLVGCNSQTISKGQLQKPAFLCRTILGSEPDGHHSTFAKPADHLEVAAIKIEPKKDKDVVRIELNDWDQQSGVDAPHLSDIFNIQINGQALDYTSNEDKTGFHAALQMEYPKGALESGGLKMVSDDIAAIFVVTGGTTSGPPVLAGMPGAEALAPGFSNSPADSTAPPSNAPNFSAAGAAPLSLEQQLETIYKLTQLSPSSAVVTKGTVLHVSGDKLLVGTPIAKPAMCSTTVTDGKPTPPVASCLAPLRLSLQRHESTYFAANQAVDVVAISVDVPHEAIEFTLVDDGAAPKYHTKVRFTFAQGYLEGSDAGQLADVVSTVLTVGGAATPALAPAPAPVTGPTLVTPTVPAAPAQHSANPGTVSVGMTKAQVLAILGKPASVQVKQAATVYVYANVEVTFVNGKVSEVQ